MVRVGLMPRRSEADALRGLVRTFAAALRTRYRPQHSYHGPARLVLVRDARLDDQTNTRQHHETLVGWRQHVPNITCWYGPGNHFTILKPSHVQVLADWWRDGLQPITRKDPYA
jgi:hypothetical protein